MTGAWGLAWQVPALLLALRVLWYLGRRLDYKDAYARRREERDARAAEDVYWHLHGAETAAIAVRITRARFRSSFAALSDAARKANDEFRRGGAAAAETVRQLDRIDAGGDA